ncbi:MAG TPA: complex I NDUFA9 subunit family protein [Candidatus Limnocylindrales bacterium]|nr:complex I NDUFA9 subunit family protein [Candidatus Limnocylindrales bacterium]
MATILVTGPNGFVGSRVVPALAAAGHRVVGLVRTADVATDLLARLDPADRAVTETRIGDVTRIETLRAALTGIDAVVHLVAIPRDRDGGASLRLVNTEGTRNVIVAMRDAGVRRLVHLGALGIADDPDLHYASSKARAERLVAESGLDWTILKPSLMFGPGDGFFNVIAGLARLSPVVPLPGLGRSRFQPLAVVDLARIVVAVLGRAEAIGRTFEVGGPRWWTYREIVGEVLRAMGTHRLVLPLPVPLIALVAASAETVGLPFPVASDQLRQLGLDNVTEPTAVRDAFGFEPLDMSGRLGYLRLRPKDQLAQAGDGTIAG